MYVHTFTQVESVHFCEPAFFILFKIVENEK